MMLIGDTSDGKSTTGYLCKLSDSVGVISWNCRKQNTVALSIFGTEYQGMGVAVQGKTIISEIIDAGLVHHISKSNLWQS